MTAWVVGGGVAGIAAAFRLRARGEQVTLLEPRSRLGGRAFSSPDPRTGHELDNGPHVILGVYTEFRTLLRRIGGEDAFVRPATLAIDYAWPGGRSVRLRLRRLPVPLAFPLALFGLRALGFAGRLRALRGLAAAAAGPPPAITLAQWLARHRQHGAPRDLLWDPMCRSIFNAEAEDVSASLFCSTLRLAFGGGAAKAAIWLPAVGWSELLDRRVRMRFEADGIQVQRGRVVALDVNGGRVQALRFADGTRRDLDPQDRVVSALPWHAAQRLLPAQVPSFGSRPIVSVCFDCVRQLPLPPDARLVSLVGGSPFHFLYRCPGAAPERCTLLAGGAIGLDGVAAAAIEQTARAQLQRWFPSAAVEGSATVRKEARATLLVGPDDATRRPRPGPVPGFTNLVLCGDWTATGLPSTLEGAALSARLALP